MRVILQHTDDNLFQASNERGITITLGAGSDAGPSPMEALLMAIGGCTGVDVVSTLKKMRQPLESLEIQVEGQRRDEHPRYFHTVIVRYILKGNLQQNKVERAVDLSLNKYCSVSNIIEPKAQLKREIIILPGGDSN